MKFKIGDKVSVKLGNAPKCDKADTFNQHGVIVGLPMWEGDKYSVGFTAVKYARNYAENELEPR